MQKAELRCVEVQNLDSHALGMGQYETATIW